MIRLLQAEMLKQKHRFPLKLLWLAPVLTVLLVVGLMGGRFFQEGAYNWWYTLMLPASFTIFVALGVDGERRKNRHGLLGVVAHKKQLWLSQIVFYTGYLLATCLVHFIVVTLGSLLFGLTIGLAATLTASVCLCITFAWQIPLWMAVTEKAGKFTAILLSLLCNFGFGVFFAAGKAWWIPFSIPSRLMCPVIGVRPNGLAIEAGSALANPNVILPGLLMTALLYFFVSIITSLWFEKREVA